MGNAFPLADPSISGQLPGSRLTGKLKNPPPPAYNHAHAPVPSALRACNSDLLLGRPAITNGYDHGRLDPLSGWYRRGGSLFLPEQEPRFDADLFQSFFNPLCVTASAPYVSRSFSLRRFRLTPATHRPVDYRYHSNPLFTVSAPVH